MRISFRPILSSPPNPIVPLAHEVSIFVSEYPTDPFMPLGQAVNNYLHPVTFTDFLLA
jgi:hypothetical protein